MVEQRPVIISCDGHATGRPEDYVPYVEPAYRAQYEEFVRELEARRAAEAKAAEKKRSLFSDEGSFGFDKETGDARDGEWNSSIRTDVLEGEGVEGLLVLTPADVPDEAGVIEDDPLPPSLRRQVEPLGLLETHPSAIELDVLGIGNPRLLAAVGRAPVELLLLRNRPGALAFGQGREAVKRLRADPEPCADRIRLGVVEAVNAC